MHRALPAVALLAAAGCTAANPPLRVYVPPPGTNQVLEGAIASDPGHSLIVGDLNMAPGAEIPRHYHYGEEFIYVLGGSATVSRAGMPDVVLRPGKGLRIGPGVVHWGKAGPGGMRAVSSWVKDDSKPLRVPVPQ
jgi:quercetin dioxygenase-like cupin family protein